MSPLLNTAKAIYQGDRKAIRVYHGTQQVWPTVATGPVEKTWEGNADWSQSYGGDNDPRNDGYLYYGYFSSTWGNNRSLIGFNVPAEVNGCLSISRINLRFYNVHAYYNDGGDIPMGVHDYSSEPASWTDSRVDQNLQTWGDAPKPGWVDVDLNSTIRERFRTGNLGIALGPGPSTSLQYYGYAAMHSSTTKPRLEIDYKVNA